MMKKMMYLVCMGVAFSVAWAEVSNQVFTKYKQNNVVFCSGVYASCTLGDALYSGFKKLYGIDSDKVLVDHAPMVMPEFMDYQKKYADECKVFHGDPRVDLLKYIWPIQEPITFVLSSCFPEPEGEVVNTILEELDQIKQHPIKNHVIMVEFIQYAGTRQFGYVTLKAVQQKLLEINPAYQFAFEKAGHHARENNALLVAYLPR